MTKEEKIVRAGSALLDVLKPGWFKKVNLKVFDIEHQDKCVLSQVFDTNYAQARDDIGFQYHSKANFALGFNVLHTKAKPLQKAWIKQITKLKKAKSKK